MPELKRYKFGRIYKVVNDIDDTVFISSTVQALSSRMSGHRVTAKRGGLAPVHQYMRKIGIKHFKIVLIEKIANVNKEELCAREDYWIEKLNAADQK